MRYVRLDNKDLEPPRFLTKNEIDKILQMFPMSYGATSKSREYSRQCQLEDILPSLQKNIISPDMIDKLMERIFGLHYKALIPPHTAVGTSASEALGATSTQATLNTFHKAGSANSVSSGIESIQELIYARPVRKNENCTIYFTNRNQSLREAFNRKSDLVGSVVRDFVSKYSILRVPRTNEDYFYLEEGEFAKQKSWSHLTNKLTGKELPASKHLLRLYLNKDELYKQRVTIKQIAEALMKEKRPTIVCSYGPMSKGIIDIYPVDNIEPKNKDFKNLSKTKEFTKEMYETMFLECVVVPSLEYLHVKGVEGIRNIIPKEIDVLQVIYQERKVELKDLPETFTYKGKKVKSESFMNDRSLWILFKNRFFSKEHGIKLSDITDLLNTISVESILKDENDMWLIVDSASLESNLDSMSIQLSPLQKLREELDKDKKKCEILLKIKNKKELEKYGKIVSRLITPTERMRKATLMIVYTVGSNLKGLFKHPGIDDRLTSCNNIYKVNNVLGIENAFAVHMRELAGTIKANNAYINMCHINMISDYVMSRGIPRGANFTGISRQAGGPLELAAVEKAGKVLTQYSFFGRDEIINTISPSIIVNAPISLGTGACHIGEDEIVDGKVVNTYFNYDIYKLHSKKEKYTEDEVIKEIKDVQDQEVREILDFANEIISYDEFVDGDAMVAEDDIKIQNIQDLPDDDIVRNHKISELTEIDSRKESSVNPYKTFVNTDSILYNCIVLNKCVEGYYFATVPDFDFLNTDSGKVVKNKSFISPKTTKPKITRVVKNKNENLSKEAESGIKKFMEDQDLFFD